MGMSENISITMEERSETRKGACKKLRPAGFTPCVFYGPEYVQSIPGKVRTAEVVKLVNSGRWETAAIDIALPDGKREMCLIREVQRDILNDDILHIDFMQLVKGRRISVNVPVHVTGREACAGVKQGGVVDHILREIPLEVLPGQIPDSIEIDISTLGLGAHVFVRDLPIPEGATLLLDEGEIAVSVIIPRGVIEAEAAEEEKEVEVLAKGKAKAEKEE